MFESVVSKAKQRSEKLCEIELQKAKDKEREIEEEKRRKHYDEEMALEEANLEMKRMFEKGLEEAKMKTASQCNSAKLPKLVISKFQGTHLDWQRFWGQFKTEIDKADINPITKLSYLKELLIPKFMHLLMVHAWHFFFINIQFVLSPIFFGHASFFRKLVTSLFFLNLLHFPTK